MCFPVCCCGQTTVVKVGRDAMLPHLSSPGGLGSALIPNWQSPDTVLSSHQDPLLTSFLLALLW